MEVHWLVEAGKIAGIRAVIKPSQVRNNRDSPAMFCPACAALLKADQVERVTQALLKADQAERVTRVCRTQPPPWSYSAGK